MDFEEVFQKYFPAVRSNIIPLGLGSLGILLLGTGLIASLNSSPQEEITFQPAEKSEVQKAKILIDVSGAVIKPGVYSLEEGARIKDALILASGLSGEADREWVDKNLNLAQKISDGSKIYIPLKGENLSSATSVGVVQASNLININSASSAELESLSGIGPVTAGKIIDGRPYQSLEDLVKKKIVGSKVFENIKDKISVY